MSRLTIVSDVDFTSPVFSTLYVNAYPALSDRYQLGIVSFEL